MAQAWILESHLCGKGAVLRERGYHRMGRYPKKCQLWEQKRVVRDMFFINTSWPSSNGHPGSVVGQVWTIFFCEWPDSKYLRLFRPHLYLLDILLLFLQLFKNKIQKTSFSSWTIQTQAAGLLCSTGCCLPCSRCWEHSSKWNKEPLLSWSLTF